MNVGLLAVGLSAGLTYSVYSALSKSLLGSRVPSALLLFLYLNVVQAVVTPCLWLAIRPVWPSVACWVPLGISAILSVAGSLLFYLALSCGDVSSVTPIMGSKVLLAGLLAIPLLGERHPWPIYLAAVLVAVAIAVLGYSPSTQGRPKFPVRPIALMLGCCLVYGCTDIYIKRSLAFVDSYNFIVYYNLIVGLGSLAVLPRLLQSGVPLRLSFGTLGMVSLAAVFLLAASLLFVITFALTDGVVVPNILIASRGVFIVLISALLGHWGVQTLDRQSGRVYGLRLAGAVLIILSIWIVTQER